MAEINGNYYSADTLKSYVDQFTRARVFVVGDVIMDEFMWGVVSRISPEAPVPVVNVNRETRMLGGAANVIRNMASLGAVPVLCGVVGNDRAGDQIVSELRRMGLRVDGVVRERERPTSIKTRVVAHHQQVVRFDRETLRRIEAESVDQLLGFINQNIDKMDAIVISDYGKGVISDPLMTGLNRLVRSKAGTPVIISVDPKVGNFQYYQGVDVITPNHYEAGVYCGFEITDEESLLRAGTRMLHDLNCRSVLITQGEEGMTLFEKGGEVTHIPTVAKRVFDVTGAGDTVIGTISLGLAAGLDLKSAAILSNFAAGIVVGEVGTSAVDAAALKKAITP
ncbi:MAG: D-glycero-beta-D-manno-heptose-7-phosphate kinase [Deltaproteobacteria bacterium]|nr:D-glycero-beta-D-manno-heptose-7-phosphate kinase [Deltaproteobacteria bacterium]MCF8119084.1 D-glycero-beta-D-manno-heptose-7-phosphate kinase [Deltaproteobacteria bacterium]